MKDKTPAVNERFGASGGVARSTSSANLQVLCPAQTAVSRHLPPSRHHVEHKILRRCVQADRYALYDNRIVN